MMFIFRGIVFFLLVFISSQGFSQDFIIKTPDGILSRTDINVFYLWSNHHAQTEKVIFAQVGKPTAPLDPDLKNGVYDYWNSVGESPISYGEAEGEKIYREKMAAALKMQYSGVIDISAKDILFTVGGLSGLNAAFFMVEQLFPRKKIVTTNPYYALYKGGYRGDGEERDLLLVDTLNHNFRLTAEGLEEALAQVVPEDIGAFVFCDPNNPLGTVVGNAEWVKIAKILKRFPNAPIILDEAYAEMVFGMKHESLLEAAPELKDQIVLLRSATKGLSAAGERMAVLVASNPLYMNKLVKYNLANVIHAPKSAQHAFTYAMEKLSPEKRIKLADFYKEIVVKIEKTLKKNNFALPQSNYTVEGSFYIISQFQDLIGLPLDERVQQVYLAKKEVIEDDIDIAFHLLFKYGLAIAPLSFFGVDKNLGYLRITCSATGEDLKQMQEKIYQIRSDIQNYQRQQEL